MLWTIVCWLIPDTDNRPTRLEWAALMDDIKSQITAIEIRIRVQRRAHRMNSVRALEKLWEELVCLHMEFEWGLHPSNPEPPSFKYE